MTGALEAGNLEPFTLWTLYHQQEVLFVDNYKCQECLEIISQTGNMLCQVVRFW